MTEDSLWQPPSKKGEIRKRLDEMIMREVENKNLTAMIVRAADFYGPDISKSVFGQTVVANLMKGKSAQVFGNIDKIHTYTFTRMPPSHCTARKQARCLQSGVASSTTNQKLTTRQWIELVANELKVKPRIQKIPVYMLYLLGVFIPLLKELPEMMYQNEMDYFFDSSKFEDRFRIKATAPEDGVKIMIDYLN